MQYLEKRETQSHSSRVSLDKKEVNGDTPSVDHIMGLWDCVSWLYHTPSVDHIMGLCLHWFSTDFTTHPQLTISWDCGTVSPLILHKTFTNILGDISTQHGNLSASVSYIHNMLISFGKASHHVTCTWHFNCYKEQSIEKERVV